MFPPSRRRRPVPKSVESVHGFCLSFRSHMEEFMMFLLVCIPLLANTVSAAESSWRPLFNGKDLSGWETYMNKPHPSWDVPGLQRDTNGVYLEAVGKNR